jgi:hypothetical protein
LEAGTFQCYVAHVQGKALVTLLGPVRAIRLVHDADRTRTRQPEQGRGSGPDHDVHVSFAGGFVDSGPATAQAAVVRGYGVPLREYTTQEIHQPLYHPYLRRQHQGLAPNFQRRPDYGLDRGLLLSPGRPPQEGAASFDGASRVP